MNAWTMSAPLEVRGHRVSIAGRAIVANARTAIDRARIVAKGPAMRDVTSRADGLFWFEDLPAGDYVITAIASGRDHVSAPVPASVGDVGAKPAWVDVQVVDVAVSRANGG
jgi:hypothetical protein